MSFFKKIREKLIGSSEPNDAQVSSVAKPCLCFTNSSNPAGPHFAMFDGLQKSENGRMCLELNLTEKGSSNEGEEQLKLCLEALDQNEGFDCFLVVKDSDYPDLNSLVQSLSEKYSSACHRLSFAIETATPQVVLIDEAHDQAGLSETEEGDAYSLFPTSRFMIDTRQYDFSKSQYPDVRPNVIQILIGDSQYFVPWDESGLTEVSQETSQPINDTPMFGGISTDQTMVIAIGQQRIEHDTNSIVLKVLWYGIAHIAA